MMILIEEVERKKKKRRMILTMKYPRKQKVVMRMALRRKEKSKTNPRKKLAKGTRGTILLREVNLSRGCCILKKMTLGGKLTL